MRKYLFVIVGFIAFVSFFTNLVDDVHAKVKGTDKVYKLAILKGVEECYSGYAKEYVEDPVPSINNIFDWNGEFTVKDDTVWIPTHVGNTLLNKNENDSNLSCKETFVGYKDDEKQAMGLLGKEGTLGEGLYSSSAVNTFEKLGYIKGDSQETDTKYVKISGSNDKFTYNGQDYNVISSGEGIVCSVTFGEEGSGWVNSVDCNEGEIQYLMKDQSDVSHTVILRSKKENNNTSFYVGDSTKQEPILPYVSVPYQSSYSENRDPVKIFSTAGDVSFGEASSTVSFMSFLRGSVRDEFGSQLAGEGTVPSCNGNCNVAISEHSVSVGYRLMKNETGEVLRKFSGNYFLNQLGVDDNLPTENETEKNLVGVAGGSLTIKKYKWSDAFIYSLYYYYLSNVSTEKEGNKLYLGGEDGCSENKGSDGYWFRNAYEHEGLNQGEKPKWCKVSGYDTYLGDVYSVYDKGSGTLKKGTFKDVLDWLNDAENNYKDMGQDDFADMQLNSNKYLVFGTGDVEQPTNPGDDDATGSVSATCQNAAGAGAMGWIICPILEWVGNSATNLYSSYVEPRLKINPKLFQVIEGTDKSPTRDAWGTFQTIANVVFIIILLLVIFSQLTGIGIDNYGIKRILPKLVVVAILVNLSYVICVICVDLSNILGSSLKGLFDGLGATLGDIPVSTGVAETTALGNDSWIPAVLVGVLVTTVVVGAATIVLNPAILLTLLISALGVAISVLFIFALFAIREAAVIVLTVVAPVAFVCYILPNTKKIFDKWLTAWKGLLLVYPVAGLLIGGGDYISRLLILVEGSGTTETGFFQLMTAMVIGIAPIFFIPSVLKGSFSALGNIGAKVAGAGKMLGGRASSRLANSSINKNAQRMGEERHARISAGLNKQGEMNALARGRAKISRRMANSKIPIVGGAIRGIGRGQMKSQASRIAAAKKDFSAGESANAMLMNEMAARGIADNGGGVDGARKYYSGLLSQAAEKGDKSGFDAALTAAAQSGYMKPKDVASMVRTMENEGKLGNLNDAEWWTRAASKHSDIMSTDFEMLSWARKGGVGGNNNPALGGYGEYAANGGVKTDDLKLEDISKLSSDSMAGLIAAGTINKGLAEQAMLNGSGLTQDKRVMLGAVASGAATSGSIQGAGGSVGEGARVFKGEAGALMQNSQATEWKDDSTGTDKKISAIHTQKTDESATWSEGSATHATASAQDIEKWMAPSAAPVNVQNWSGGPSGPGGGGSAGPDGPSGPGGSVRGGGIAAGSSGGGAVAGETFDVRRLEEDTLLDMATNPNVEMNNPIRMAAAEEYERRTGYSSGGVSAPAAETVVEAAPVAAPESAPVAEVVEAVPAPEPAPAPAPAPAPVSDSRSSSDVQGPSVVQQAKTSFDQFKNPAPRPEPRRPEPRPVQPPKNISQNPGITGGRRLRSADRARRMMGGNNNGGNGGTSS